MEKENQRRFSELAQNQASVIASWGWKSSRCSPLPVEGETFFLTFPFIEQAISRFELQSGFE
jgi:hypothetical protein